MILSQSVILGQGAGSQLVFSVLKRKVSVRTAALPADRQLVQNSFSYVVAFLQSFAQDVRTIRQFVRCWGG